MRFKFISLLLLTLSIGACATVQTKVGALALKLMTKKEADFNNIAVIGTYQTNVAATDVGITTLGTEDWQEGENLVGVQLVKPAGAIGVIALDGTVNVDGKEAKSYGGGAYYARFAHDDRSPKTVSIISANGEETTFELAAAPSLSITSVNGRKEQAAIDLGEPLEIGLQYTEDAEGDRVMVALITKAVGVTGFANFYSTIIDGKVTVPAEAFRHKHIAGGGPTGKDVTNWQQGENYLQVSIIENSREQKGLPFPYFRRESKSFDTIPVTVSGEAEGRAWVSIKGESKENNGTFKYVANASNAWYSRPLDTNIDRIGIASLSVSGTLYKEESETSEENSMDGSYITITTTTTTFEFPQLDDAYWNQFLENIYADLTDMLKSEYQASVVDVDEITANPIYDEFYTPQDENTKEYIAKNLRDTKRLLPNALGEIMGDRTTSLIADDGTTPRLLRDMNLDAIMDVVINYQVAANKDENIVLIPNVSYRISGQPQSFDGTTGVWLQGSIKGPGIAFSREEFSDLNALNRIGQKEVILKLIRQSIAELTAEQKEHGYQKVWAKVIGE